MEPSAFGYRSIRPRTRKERLSKKDKVALEKGRINEVLLLLLLLLLLHYYY
jgi:hypothetical protein